MAPLRLLAALLAAHLQFQLNFGQQINEGNNLVAVASHKLAAIKQQSQKLNVTDLDQTTDLEENLEVTTDKNLDPSNFNSSATYPGSGTITSIKFVRNPAYDGPLPTFAINNSENESDPIFRTLSPDSPLYNCSRVAPNSGPTYTTVGQVVNKQTEENVGYMSKSPLFISFAPRCSGAVSSQAPYIINALPPRASSPNIATLPASPPLNQQSHQTLSLAQLQPSSVQNPTNMRLRFVPASTTVPFQSTAPVKNTVPIQCQVPMQNTIPVQNTVQMPNPLPTQSAVPIQSTLPMPSAIPIQSTVPIQSTIPIQRAISNIPIQSPIANILQNPNLALLLTHILSQNPVKHECSAPTNTQCPSHDQKPTKQTTVKTLLPLLLQLLSEKNNNCCDYKSKNERPRSYKQGYKKKYDKFDVDFGRSEGNHYYRINGNKRYKKPLDDTLEDEDYSDETSEYTAEEYDDED